MNIYRILLLPALMLICSCGISQELKCRVSITSSELQNADRDIINKMDQAIEEFMNNRSWTKHTYSPEELIEVNFNIRLSNQSSTLYEATIQVQASRPVYGATYTSPMINYLDENFVFEFKEFETLDFDENSHQSNLTSVLAYYAYIILGLDYDSFSKDGGSEYFQIAQNIVNNAQTSNSKGWKSSESKKNRYWLVEDMLNSSYSGFRSCMYMYHRLGLDQMHKKASDGRKKIEDALYELEKVYKTKPGAFLLDFFFYAKATELQNIYSEAMPDEKKRVLLLLKKLNSANASDYDKALK